MRWATPGFTTLIAGGNVPTPFQTGPLTFWVNLDNRGFSMMNNTMAGALKTVEPYIHTTLIDNLPELPGAYYTIIQDPGGSVDVAVVNPSGMTSGVLPNGNVRDDTPLAFVYQSSANPGVVLGNPQPVTYLIILTGTSPNTLYDLRVSTHGGNTAGRQSTASDTLAEKGAMLHLP
jgi:hypothetical protein